MLLFVSEIFSLLDKTLGNYFESKFEGEPAFGV